MPLAAPSASAAAPSPSGSRPHPPRRTWPVTAGAVLLGWCFGAWVLFVAAINTAPFFGEQPTRDENIESGLALVTGALPLLLLAVAAVRWGSRWGILLLVVPTVLLVPLGLEWASRTGSDRDPAPERSMAWSDLGGELLRLNWVLAAVLGLVLAVSVLRSRHARRSGPALRSAPALRSRRAARTVPGDGREDT